MNGEFQLPPLKTLDEKETLALLKLSLEEIHQLDRELGGMGKWRIKSLWLCELLNQREKTHGFQYNAEFLRWFEKEYGVGPFAENGSTLSILIYNAQGYRRHDRLVAEGWQPGSEALLQEAFEQNRMLEIRKSSLFGGVGITPLKIKKVGDKLYAMAPKKRKYAVNIVGEPVRMKGEVNATS